MDSLCLVWSKDMMNLGIFSGCDLESGFCVEYDISERCIRVGDRNSKNRD